MTRALCLLIGLGAGLAIAARRNARAWDAAESLFNAEAERDAQSLAAEIDYAAAALVQATAMANQVKAGVDEAAAAILADVKSLASERDEVRAGLDLYREHMREPSWISRMARGQRIDEWEAEHGHRWPTRTT